MQIYPVKFRAKQDQTEFRIEITAKRAASTAVVKIFGAQIALDGKMVDIADQWSIKRSGPSATWILVSEKPITQPVELMVFATGSCGQVCPKLFILPDPKGIPSEVVDDDTPSTDLTEGQGEDLEPVKVEEVLTPTQISLLQASRFVGIHAGTTIQEDFDVLVERGLIELVDGEWRAK